MPRLLLVHHTPSPGTPANIGYMSGSPSRDDLAACWELGATIAAELAGGAG